jgi:hypothetical protein
MWDILNAVCIILCIRYIKNYTDGEYIWALTRMKRCGSLLVGDGLEGYV